MELDLRALGGRGPIEEQEAAEWRGLLAAAAALAERLAETTANQQAEAFAWGLRKRQRDEEEPCPFCGLAFEGAARTSFRHAPRTAGEKQPAARPSTGRGPQGSRQCCARPPQKSER